jgi:hypothetical protein
MGAFTDVSAMEYRNKTILTANDKIASDHPLTMSDGERGS